MPDLVIAASVTRPELGGGDLAISEDNGYEIVSWSPGQTVWRRQTARSNYTHGETLVGAVKDSMRSLLLVRVGGATDAQMWSRIDALTAAFEQFSYQLTVTINGQVSTVRCEPADWTVGDSDSVQKYPLMARLQEVSLIVPRSPIPVAGVV